MATLQSQACTYLAEIVIQACGNDTVLNALVWMHNSYTLLTIAVLVTYPANYEIRSRIRCIIPRNAKPGEINQKIYDFCGENLTKDSIMIR